MLKQRGIQPGRGTDDLGVRNFARGDITLALPIEDGLEINS